MNAERRAFLIFTIIVSILFIFLFGYNVYSWNRIRTNTTETNPVNRSEANVLFWLNLIWILVSVALLIWAVYEATQTFGTKTNTEYKIVSMPKQTIPVTSPVMNVTPSVAPVMNVSPSIAPPVVSQVIPLYKTTSMQKEDLGVCRL